MESTLTAAVLQFQSTGIGRESLLALVALTIYRYPRRCHWCTDDDCSEFYVSFFPRLLRLLVRYRFSGRPFETYLQSSLKWHLRTYIGARASRQRRERVLALPEVCAEGPAWTEQPDLPDTRRPAVGRLVGTQACRQMVLLVLKCAMCVKDQLVEHVAILTGQSRDWLFHAVHTLRVGLAKRRARIEQITERRNACYFRLLCLRAERIECLDPDRVQAIDARIAEEHRRLRLAQDELSRVPICPTHIAIARVLGVPKGTVDSGVFYARERLPLRFTPGGLFC